MSELKPCPFCGGEAEFCACINDCGRIVCIDCGVEVLWNEHEHEDNAASWNDRTRDTKAK